VHGEAPPATGRHGGATSTRRVAGPRRESQGVPPRAHGLARARGSYGRWRGFPTINTSYRWPHLLPESLSYAN